MTKLFTFYLVRDPFLVKFGAETERRNEGGGGTCDTRKRDLYTGFHLQRLSSSQPTRFKQGTEVHFVFFILPHFF